MTDIQIAMLYWRAMSIVAHDCWYWGARPDGLCVRVALSQTHFIRCACEFCHWDARREYVLSITGVWL